MIAERNVSTERSKLLVGGKLRAILSKIYVIKNKWSNESVRRGMCTE